MAEKDKVPLNQLARIEACAIPKKVPALLSVTILPKVTHFLSPQFIVQEKLSRPNRNTNQLKLETFSVLGLGLATACSPCVYS